MNEMDCYLLGFLYADCCIYNNYINIRLAAKDRDYLLNIRDIFYPGVDRPYYQYITKNKNLKIVQALQLDNSLQKSY